MCFGAAGNYGENIEKDVCGQRQDLAFPATFFAY